MMEIVEMSQINKAKIKEQVETLKQQLDNGEIDPLKVMGFSKYLSELSVSFRNVAMDYAITEFEKYGEREIQKGGVVFRKKEAGVRRDYSNTPIWNEIKAKEQAIADKRKSLEKMLANLSKAGEFLFDGEDELHQMYKPIITSTTIIECTIKGWTHQQ